jgi:hypothetical protein
MGSNQMEQPTLLKSTLCGGTDARYARPMATKEEIGKWLFDEITANGHRRTYQSSVVGKIRANFGNEWSYTNHNGNQAIDKGVLNEFGKLKHEHLLWDRSDQSWRIVTDEQLERIRSQKQLSLERKAAWEAQQAERRRS